jgi:bacterioferritin (cytochrome b1)
MLNVTSYPRPTRPQRSLIDVRSIANHLRHYAYAEMRLMEAHAGWLSSIPPFELKIELAYHLYDDACHVDEMRKRLPEVGAFDQQLTPASPQFAKFCNELQNTESTIERLVGSYWVLRPHLVQLYRALIDVDDHVGDHPTVRILRRAIADHEQAIATGNAFIDQLTEGPDAHEKALSWYRHLILLLTDAGCAGGDLPIGTVQPTPVAFDDGPGNRFRLDNPARDGRFRVGPYVRKEGRAATDVWDNESLLKYMFMNVEGEIEATESCGRTLFDFNDAPWELRFLVARQLWDEARHAEASINRFLEMDGHFDMLPVRDTFPLYWGPTQHTDLAKRLVHLNQIVEGWVTDDFAMMVEICRGLGDEKSAHLFEYLIADEWLHIKIGADWIPKLTSDSPAHRSAVMDYRFAAEKEHFEGLNLAAEEVATVREARGAIHGATTARIERPA